MRKIDVKSRFIPRSQWIAATTEKREGVITPALHKHEGYELVLVESGACTLHVEEKSYALGAGDCVFIAEGEHHRAEVPGRCTFTYLDFRPGLLFNNRDLLDRFLRPFLNGLGGGGHKWSGRTELVAEVRGLARAVWKSGREDLELTERVLRLMRLFAKLKCSRPRRSLIDRARIQPAVDLVYQRYDGGLSVATMAAACAMSRATFKRAFRAATGRPPKAFLNEHRLQQAANMLLTTDRKVADVAARAGFGNLSHFNRRFLARFGETPGGYRGK